MKAAGCHAAVEGLINAHLMPGARILTVLSRKCTHESITGAAFRIVALPFLYHVNAGSNEASR